MPNCWLRRCGIIKAGQLAEAEGHYRKILTIDRNHVDSLHLLGFIAHQVGRYETAVDLIRKSAEGGCSGSGKIQFDTD